jgi:hypothetical protein
LKRSRRRLHLCRPWDFRTFPMIVTSNSWHLLQ